ncbi:GatB/YqeY domain-containing protein [Natronogracilivirga saccharolytica]|uniref:GatB/YqeY domain-containing protein n=1 Tax=Natronogracilivirga saccharolytica TaxID=2812953 RepID=A0A8J7RI05_9BACT|nr:GatB/YqeY domain-containing protein [Natronogracilivirga saccharolytica]MBP3191572.1 GatB/YqeY domain-containing protein [Natronogracilivirga saccharolytica]
MSAIYEKILADLKDAMRNKDTQRLQVLRSLKSKILEREISERKGGDVTLSDEQVQQVLMKSAKQRKESISQYKDAGRTDLAQTEEYELGIIEAYLPEMLSEDEIRDIVKNVIDKIGASSKSDMGKVMGTLMPRVKGKADGSVVNRIVRELLD